MLGFAFYLQPCLLPLLAEMPPGAAGVRLMTAATRTVIMGVATVVRAPEGQRTFSGRGCSGPSDRASVMCRLC